MAVDWSRLRFPKRRGRAEPDEPAADVGAVRRAVFRRERYRCRTPWCTGRATDLHEVVPRSRGGKVSLANCIALCRDCHRARHQASGERKLHIGLVDGRDATTVGGVTFRIGKTEMAA